MVLGNICNVIYLLVVINSKNIIYLIIAEIFSGLAFSLKNIVEPVILNGSINNAKKEEKSKIFAKIQGKAVAGYYAISAFSMIISGFLYEINGYFPLLISLGIVIVTLIMSTKFEDVQVEEKEEQEEMEETVSLKEAIKYVFEAKRIRCLLIYSAILNLISALASKNQQVFQNKFKNRTLMVLGLSLSISCIIAGTISKLNIAFWVIISIILIMYIIKYSVVGLYNVLREKYLSNFTNSKIDTKIFAIYNFSRSLLNVIFGVFASALLQKTNISNAMLIFGIVSLIIITIVLKYMKDKVGLDPEKYSKTELKYDTKV